MINLAVQQEKLSQKRKGLRTFQSERNNLAQSLQLIAEELSAKIQSSATDVPSSDPLRIKQAELSGRLQVLQNDTANSDAAVRTLQEELYAQQGVEELVAQLPGEIPFLLLPVRLETRFCRVRHVAKPANRQFLIDISDIFFNEISTQIFRNWGIHHTPEGMALQVRGPFPHHPNLTFGEFLGWLWPLIPLGGIKPPNGKWLQAKEDALELRIRIVPDNIHIDSFEANLTPEELQRGKHFWERIWKSDNPEQERDLAWAELRHFYSAPRSAWCVRQTQPKNLGSGTTFSGEPQFPARPLRANSYTQPPVAAVLPDHFTAILSRAGHPDRVVKGNLITQEILTGFDPNEPDSTAFQPDEHGDLKFPEALRWIFDFDEAEKRGMAIRVPLDPEEFTHGFDNLVVLGVKLSAGKMDGKELLEGLLHNHTYQEKGMYVVPQGTPTNNFGAAKSGYNWPEREAALHLKAAYRAGQVWTDKQRSDHFSKPDGLRLTEALGIDEEYSRRLPGADNEDAREALAMNRLLFPGTLGYYLRQFFLPPLTEPAVGALQGFFERFVTGRGLLPAIRIGQQPYGLIPTSAFKFWTSKIPFTPTQLLVDHGLKKLDVFLDEAKSSVRFAGDGKARGAQYSQELIELARTDPTSSRYEQRALFGEGYLNTIFRMNLREFLGVHGALLAPPEVNEFPGKIDPALRAKFLDPALFSSFRFMHVYAKTRELRGPLVDSVPSSESDLLSLFPGSNINYLDWLRKSPIENVWKERFQNLTPTPIPPRALLYHYARFALRRGALEQALRLAEPNGKLRLLQTRDLELLSILDETQEIKPASLNDFQILGHYFKPLVQAFGINDNFRLKRDRFKLFEQSVGTPPKLVKDILETGDAPEAKAFRQQRDTLGVLRGLPTARLERLFCEHIDLCSYRLDAWFSAVVLSRLDQQRRSATSAQGIYLGAFGVLENVRPQTPAELVKEVEPVFTDHFDQATTALPFLHFKGLQTLVSDVDKLLQNSFVYLGSTPSSDCMVDIPTGKVVMKPVDLASNKGFVQGPSPEHAATAAILRAGWESRKAEDGNDQNALAVRVDSPRVRAALSLLEGIGQGDTLAALLGYQLERMLHDLGEDPLIFRLRKIFPLKTDQAVSSFAATIDGMAFVKSAKDGWPHTALNASEQSKLNPLATSLDGQFDALSDLMLTESVFQMVKDSPARAAAALRTMNASGQLHQPEVVRTPQSGVLVTFRTGVVFPRTDFLTKWGSLTPRAIASPNLNNWLASQLPDPTKIFMTATSGNVTKPLTLKDLKIQPLDLLAIFPSQDVLTTQPNHLAWLAQSFFRAKQGLPPNVEVKIDFTSSSSEIPDGITIFELSPLVNYLRLLVASARLLNANHFLREGSQGAAPVFDDSEIEQGFVRLVKEEKQLTALVQQIVAATSALQSELAANRSVAERQKAWSNLVNALAEVARWQNDNPALEISPVFAESQLALLIMKANHAAATLERLNSDALALIDRVVTVPANEKFTICEQLGERLFGKTFRICPKFKLTNVPVVKRARNTDLSRNLSSASLENWQCHSALVHPAFRLYRHCVLLREALAAPGAENELTVIQLNPPGAPAGFWVGAEMQGTDATEDVSQGFGGTLSLALELPDNWVAEGNLTGLMFDEWTDVLPARKTTTGVAFHFNQPDTEPPQVMLLAVCPAEGQNWRWDYLKETIFETMERAKKRLVTLAHLQENPALKHLLPAVVTPLDRENLTPNLDLGRNTIDRAIDENGGVELEAL